MSSICPMENARLIIRGNFPVGRFGRRFTQTSKSFFHFPAITAIRQCKNQSHPVAKLRRCSSSCVGRRMLSRRVDLTNANIRFIAGCARRRWWGVLHHQRQPLHRNRKNQGFRMHPTLLRGNWFRQPLHQNLTPGNLSKTLICVLILSIVGVAIQNRIRKHPIWLKNSWFRK